jgi:serine phosphatase RsbU (regulator of sigma subunit)/uncharacterized damage-inducible protein DinB
MRKNRLVLYALIFCASVSFLPAQNAQKIDSLLQIVKTTQKDTSRIKVWNALAWEYRNIDFKKSLEFVEKSVQSGEKINFKTGLAEAYSYKGLIYRNMGDYASALEFYLKSLKLSEETGNQAQVGYGYNNIGEIHKNQEHYPPAIENIQKAISIFAKIKDMRGLGYGYLRLGEVYQAQKDYNNALANFRKSLEIREKSNDPHAVATSLSRVGIAYLNLNNIPASIEYLEKALAIFEKNKDKRGITSVIADLSRAYQANGDASKAIYYANKSLQMAQELPSPEYIKKASEILFHIYESKKNFEKAFQYQSFFLAAKDSLQKENMNKEITKLTANYALDKKQAEVDLLNKDKIIQEDAIWRQRIGLMTSGGIIVLFFGFLIFLNRINRQRQKANLSLQAQKVEIQNQKNEIESQRDNLNNLLNDLSEKNKIIEKKNEDTQASIQYAKNIQNALLSANADLSQFLPDHFVFFRPRDIVSGDFYWFAYKNVEGQGEKLILAAVDCTGHGVPGAFMSLIGDSLLNQIVHDLEIHEPAAILNELHQRVQHNLNQQQNKNRDGMDIALCSINLTHKTLTYAGARNPLIYIQEGELKEIKGDIHSIGGVRGLANYQFKQYTVDVSKSTTFYIFSDGFQDQFGGEKQKKFMVSRFRRMLFDIHRIPINLQEEVLEQGLEDWMNEGKERQTDDILVVGVKLSLNDVPLTLKGNE